jgi:hypothetical protein
MAIIGKLVSQIPMPLLFEAKTWPKKVKHRWCWTLVSNFSLTDQGVYFS